MVIYNNTHNIFFSLTTKQWVFSVERVIDKKAIIGVFTELRWWGAKN